jgi:hypothetical protein
VDEDTIIRLLAEARKLREGRDQWRQRVGPVLHELRAAKVSYSRIQKATGISPGTVARIARTGGSTPSPTE